MSYLNLAAAKKQAYNDENNLPAYSYGQLKTLTPNIKSSKSSSFSRKPREQVQQRHMPLLKHAPAKAPKKQLIVESPAPALPSIETSAKKDEETNIYSNAYA